MTVAGAPSGGHALLLYRVETQRQARVVSWVRQGLVRGEKILYSTVPGDPLVDVLTGVVAHAGATPRPGQLTVLASQELFPGARQGELVHRALEEGYPGVRLSARADVGLRDTRSEAYRTIDQLTDELCATLPVTALCQLDAASADDATLTTVLETHSVVEDDQMRLRRGDDRVVVLAGEVDSSSADLLTRALQRLVRPQADAAAVLDLSGLSFVDVAGCRALVVGTEELRSSGGSVRLTRATDQISKVLTLLGVDRLPGVELS